MKAQIKQILVLFLFFGFNGYSQEKIGNYYQYNVVSHESGSGDDVFIDQGILYIPIRKKSGEFYINKYSLETKQLLGKFTPTKDFNNAPGFVIDDGHIYYHTDSYITKVNIQSNEITWKSYYESSWSAQIAPELFDDHVGISLDDIILILNKKDGSEYIKLKGKEWDQTINMSDEYFVFCDYEKPLEIMDLKTKKVLYKVNVGEECGTGFTKDENHLIFPSSRVMLTCVDESTGKKIWQWESDELDGGCGHGFNDAPTKIGNKLYTNQRETGLYIFNKDNGELLQTIDFNENICTERFLYNGKIIVIGEEHLFEFDPTTNEYKTLAEYPINEEAMPYISFQDQYLCLHSIGSYSEPNCRLFDLNELLKN